MIDFNNQKGANLGDPKFGQDAVNLRTLQRIAAMISGDSVSAVVSGITSGNNIAITGTTSAITISLVSNVSTTSINANTIYSAGTDLYSIFITQNDGNDITRVQPGINTYTAGTMNNPTVNLSAATLDHLSVSGKSYFTGDIHTPQNEYFYTGDRGAGFYSDNSLINPNNLILFTDSGLTNTILELNDGSNFWTDSTTSGSINLVVGSNAIALNNSNDSLSLIGGTGGTIINSNAIFNSFVNIQSASTDNTLTNIFVRASNGDVSLRNVTSIITGATSAVTYTFVQNGLNTYTGGTASLPTVNISAATLTSLSATSISGSSIFSGSTNLYSIFQPALTISNGLTLAGNSLKLGGALINTTNITGNQTFNIGTTSARINLLNTFTTTHTELFAGSSATTTQYSALGLYGSGTNYSAILQSTDNANLTSFELTPGSIQGLIGSSVVLTISSTGATVINNGTGNTIVIDDPNAKGAVYNSDFSANFTPESLITKRYVDNAITGVTSALTGSVNINGLNTYTGGTITNQSINISGGTFDNLTVTGNTSLNFSTGNTFNFPTQASIATPSTGVTIGSINQQGFSIVHHIDSTGAQIEAVRDNLCIVRNTTGSLISKGQAVYVTGSTGTVPTVALSISNSLTSLPTVGIVFQDISNNSFGRIMLIGNVENFNLSSFSAGDLLYVSSTTPGGLTNVRPTYPNYAQSVGIVLNNGVGNGVLQVFIRVVEGIKNGDSATLSSLTATTISASTFYSGSTNLSTIFSSLDTYVTATTYNNQTITIKQNKSQPDIVVSLVDFTTGFLLGGM